MEPGNYMNMKFMEKVRLHFLENPFLDSTKLLEFCRREKIGLTDFSSVMYQLLESFFCHGASSKFTGDYNPKQLGMGVAVETEHTNNPIIAKKIAKDHLAEIPDYCDRLLIMETAAGKR